MSAEDFNPFPEGEWEDFNFQPWNEAEWQKYLQGSRREVGDFIAIYKACKDKPGHIEQISRRMGWDYYPSYDQDFSDSDTSVSFKLPPNPGADPSSNYESNAYYTFHRHPVYIFSTGLYTLLNEKLVQFAASPASLPGRDWGIRFAHSFHHGEVNTVIALQFLEMGDYPLTICHLKLALSALNKSFSILQELEPYSPVNSAVFYKEAKRILFDLREVWLHVIRDCREEIQDPSNEGD